MTPDEINRTYQRTRAWLAGRAAAHRAFSASKEKHFRELLRAVTEVPCLTAAANAITAGDYTFPLVVALCTVGPSNAGPPPADIIEELRVIFVETSQELSQDRLVEVMIAYGCGNWRSPAGAGPSNDDWQSRWSTACELLAHYVEAWLRRTAGWLHFGIMLDGYAWRAPWPSFSDGLSWASALWMGTCDCWRMGKPLSTVSSKGRSKRVGLTARQLEQKRTRCWRTHRLSAWNPSTISLNNFVAQAIKGSQTAVRKFGSDAVFRGMYFRDLHDFDDVRFGTVLGWRCPLHPAKLSEGSSCSACKRDKKVAKPTVFVETEHTRGLQRARLLVRAPTGSYVEDDCWHCQIQGCGNYYAEHFAACPVCGEERTNYATPSTVWVRMTGPLPNIDKGDGKHKKRRDALQKAIRTLLVQLDQADQEIVDSICNCGQSAEDVAKRLGRSPDEVKKRYQKLLQQLKRQLLGDDGNDTNDNDEDADHDNDG